MASYLIKEADSGQILLETSGAILLETSVAGGGGAGLTNLLLVGIGVFAALLAAVG